MIGMELELQLLPAESSRAGASIHGAGPSGAKSGGAGDGGIAMAVFPFKAGIFKFQWKIEAGGLQLRSCEGEGAAPAAVRHAVIPFAGDASRGATGDFPATIHSSPKAAATLKKSPASSSFPGDAQGAFPGDEIIAEAKLELMRQVAAAVFGNAFSGFAGASFLPDPKDS